MGDALPCCPECGDFLNYNAKSCSCGWKAKADLREVSAHIEASHAHSVAVANRRAAEWLKQKGLLRGEEETQSSYMRRLCDYRERLKKTPRPAMDRWASEILQRNEDGEMVPLHSLALAREAMNELGKNEL